MATSDTWATGGTGSITYSNGTTSTTMSTFAYDHQREMLERAIRHDERCRIEDEIKRRKQFRPSPDHYWSDYDNAWIYRSPYADEPKPKKKKLSFLEQLQADVDEWLSDVELSHV